MIVMPLYADQYDNAQRIEETGFGIRLNPFEWTEQQLLDAIEKLLNDNELAFKMKEISERIKADMESNELVEAIESVVINENKETSLKN